MPESQLPIRLGASKLPEAVPDKLEHRREWPARALCVLCGPHNGMVPAEGVLVECTGVVLTRTDVYHLCPTCNRVVTQLLESFGRVLPGFERIGLHILGDERQDAVVADERGQRSDV